MSAPITPSIIIEQNNAVRRAPVVQSEVATLDARRALLLARKINHHSLNSEFDALWQGMAQSLELRAQALIDASQSVARDNVSLLAQMGGAARMLALAKTEWEMTEVLPGDCAGLTYEQSPDDDRIAARELMQRALNLAAEVMTSYEQHARGEVRV